MRHTALLTLTALAFLAPAPAQAAAPPATYYVDCRAGNDANPGTSPAHP
ncbi:hypothetical protein GT350_41215, partial [Streptomyces sp. SID1034]|nr:hypothetical protein [Streptomyces sp. SID1034]